MKRYGIKMFCGVVLLALVSAPQLQDSISPIKFYTSAVANLVGSGQVTGLFRQSDGTYTALTFGIVPPFLKSAPVPNYQSTLLSTLPASAPFGTSTAPAVATNPNGVAAQLVLFADLIGDGSLAAVGPVPDKPVLTPLATPNQILVGLGNPDISYKSVGIYTVSTKTVAVLSADFNADGTPDLAVAAKGDSGNPGGVFVLLGTGGGAFKPAASLMTSGGMSGLAASDLNGDGTIDLVATDSAAGRIAALLGKGDGTFGAPVFTAVGAGAAAASLADLNGDGKMDAVVANPASGNVTILLGNGDGTFQTSGNFAAGSGAIYPAIGDFNGDTKPDLVVANRDANSVSLLLGRGDGTFGTAAHYATSLSPFSVVLTDFNHDGKLDVVVGSGNSNLILPGLESQEIQVLLGNGDGTLFGAPYVQLAGGGNAVATGDFNKDGLPDVVTANQSTDDVSILLATAPGRFGAPASLSVRPTSGKAAPSAIAVADFNQDGNPDLAIANTLAGTVAIAFGTGKGSFQTPVLYPAGGGPSGIAITDLNKDGKLDLVVSDFGPSAATAGVSVLLGQAGGGFKSAVQYKAGSGPAAVSAGDFNGDGTPDIVVVNSGTADAGSISILLANPDGTLRTATNFQVGTNPGSVAVGDFNKDGKLDLAVSTFGTAGASIIAILAGNGDGTFKPAVTYPTEVGPVSVLAQDFDLDGKLDLVIAHCCGATGMTVMRGNGDGSFQPEIFVNGGNSPLAMALADLDGDGRMDVVATNAPRSGITGLTVLINQSSTPPVISSVANATGEAPVIAPNTWIEIKGSNLAPHTRIWGDADFVNGQLPTQLDGVSVTINGKPAYVYYISQKQVNVLSPLDSTTGSVQVQIRNGGATSPAFSVSEQPVSPGFFQFSGGYAAAIHVGGTYIGPTSLYPGLSTPAKPGEPITLFANGFGQVSPPVTAGSAAQSGSLPAPPVITIGNQRASVQFAGLVLPGLFQFNITVPDSVPDGDQPLTATYNGSSTQSGVLITVHQ